MCRKANHLTMCGQPDPGAGVGTSGMGLEKLWVIW